jgi:hypothetical protein
MNYVKFMSSTNKNNVKVVCVDQQYEYALHQFAFTYNAAPNLEGREQEHTKDQSRFYKDSV